MKYELTKVTRTYNGVTLRQIRALSSFSDVKAGDLGGWVESDANLSQEGECWVYGNAMVYNDAKVADNAQIRGSAQVRDHSQVFGDAVVEDHAVVAGHSKVHDRALLSSWSSINEYAVLREEARVVGGSHIFGEVIVTGDAEIGEGLQLDGRIEVRGNI